MSGFRPGRDTDFPGDIHSIRSKVTAMITNDSRQEGVLRRKDKKTLNREKKAGISRWRRVVQ
jgi:hypothetical protein